MGKYAKWDIWLAAVAFEDDPSAIKLRPVVINNCGDAFIMAFYITSQSPRPGYHDYVIKCWREAGLEKPSTVRLDRVLRLMRTDLKTYVGQLAQQDILSIQLELARIVN